MIKYNKPPISIEKQIDLLISRGLNIFDREEANKFLSCVNYYRFSAYTLVYEKKIFTGRSHLFRENCTFRDVLFLYESDRKIRNLILAILLDLEVIFKSKIAYFLTINHKDPFIHCNKHIIKNDYLSNSTTEKSDYYNNCIKKLDKEQERSTEMFVEHYKKTYTDFPKMPLWMTIENMTLGTLSKYYSMLINDEKKKLCSAILSNEIKFRYFESWLHCFAYIRNLCAHNGRVFNRVFAIKPLIPNKVGKASENERLYHIYKIFEYIFNYYKIKSTDLIFLKKEMDFIVLVKPFLRKALGYPDFKGFSYQCNNNKSVDIPKLEKYLKLSSTQFKKI